MKKKVFCMILIIFGFLSCKKELSSKATINSFEVQIDTNFAPSKVSVIYEITVKNYGVYTFTHPGASSSLSEADTSSLSFGQMTGNQTFKDTLKLYYLNPGNYEIKLETNSGDERSNSFTLD